MRYLIFTFTALLFVSHSISLAQSTSPATKPAKVTIETLVDQPDDWFRGQGKTIADNIITWQNKNGGWWKAYDFNKPDSKYDPVIGKKSGSDSGFDNGATYSELRILARAYRVTGDKRYKQAFDRGLQFIFETQYPNGGWPQRFPLKTKGGTMYSRYITFNDDAMTSVMWLLKDIRAGKKDFAFVSEADRAKCQEAFERGIDCILKCQVKIDGKPTVWCQQHDDNTLAPTHARAYELPSLCSYESAAIVMLLMSIEKPSAEIREAVDGAVSWFQRSKITGKRYERVRKTTGAKVSAVVFEDDPAAPPIWARFYDLETGKPFFCDRDGVKKPSINDIGKERRNGYAWYNVRGNEVLAAYQNWK